ncbi:MAG: hypothetical protein EZS28_042414 [Streblomastix strix]|uniref:Uncharacterized protein n=1 Tax=Streblomastix strix TaxID=222440 RepID=A0A5J4TVZ6_9EUKA|nr:MAG: hypothetical protein EZS28_042414 [Streblomastix strix]
MQTELKIQNATQAIVSFTDSYKQNKQRKQNEQPESEQTTSATDIVSSLESLRDKIRNNNTSKYVIQIPKLLHSLVALVTFRLGTHLREQIDQQRLEVRYNSRRCLFYIQYYGDQQKQQELVNNGYGRVMSISISTAGGVGEEQDYEIGNGLKYISDFLRELHEGRYDWQPSFQPLPLLVRRSEEQIEEEGADEELEAQIITKGYNGYIKSRANRAKAETLNHFINWLCI